MIGTSSGDLRALADRLVVREVEEVVMESTTRLAFRLEDADAALAAEASDARRRLGEADPMSGDMSLGAAAAAIETRFRGLMDTRQFFCLSAWYGNLRRGRPHVARFFRAAAERTRRCAAFRRTRPAGRWGRWRAR